MADHTEAVLRRIRRRACRRTAERILTRAQNDRAMAAAVADDFNEFFQCDLPERPWYAIADAASEADYYSQ